MTVRVIVGSMTAARATRARIRKPPVTVDLPRATRILLEQCAACAGTTAEDHIDHLIKRDAFARGLTKDGPRSRLSVIVDIGDDPLSDYANFVEPYGVA